MASEHALLRAMLRVRMSMHDAHYDGGLIDGARCLALFGDVATELLIRYDGNEGLFRAYSSVEFLAPVHAGDYLEILGEIVSVGRTSRKMRFEAWKVIELDKRAKRVGDATVLSQPLIVCRAEGTCVVPPREEVIA